MSNFIINYMTALEQFRFPQQPQLSTPEPLKDLDLEVREVFNGFLIPISTLESKAQREEK